MQTTTYQADVIIVGGGLAGIVTAYELLNSGKKVMIVDRDTEANFGGLAKWSFGGMFFVDSQHQRKRGIRDSVELAMQDWFSFAEFEKGEDWGKKWAEKYINLCTSHSYEWMRNMGFTFFPVVNWTERGLFRPGNSVPRFHILWGTGWGLMLDLIRHLKRHPKVENLQLVFDHRVTEIIFENEITKGVRGKKEADDAPFEAKGEIVVVAAGGINGSIEKVKAHWDKTISQKPPKIILNGSHEYAVGDLHEAAQRLNGNVVNLEKQWNYAAGIRHYKPRHNNHGLSLVPCKSALWLNHEGRRFGPMPLVTPYDTRYLVERICQEPVKYSWQVMNYKIAKKEFAISGSEHNELIRDHKFLKFVLQTLFKGNKKLVNKIIDNCEDVITANSTEELVEKMNSLTGEGSVKLNYVKEAIQKYDAQIERGTAFHNDEQLRRIAHVRQYRGDRVRTCHFQKIQDQKAMPLIAIRKFILSRKSLGGIQTDLDCRVLTKPDQDGHQNAIEGLFAVGEAAGFGGGGIHGKRSLEGTFLGACIITGRTAARAIEGKKLE